MPTDEPRSDGEGQRPKLDHVPIRVSDLMRGFQNAVARANSSSRQAGTAGASLAPLVIRNLDVSLDAPVVHTGADEDPVVMLPSVNSVSDGSPIVRLSFSIVSVPSSEVR